MHSLCIEGLFVAYELHDVEHKCIICSLKTIVMAHNDDKVFLAYKITIWPVKQNDKENILIEISRKSSITKPFSYHTPKSNGLPLKLYSG